jgi:hypothetical protein
MLTAGEIHALQEALDDEYRAFGTYTQVVADFGEIVPFVDILKAEARHVGALQALFRRYGLPIPESHWQGKVARYATLRAACEAGVASEIANASMHDRLLAASERPEVREVLPRLQSASQRRHLPALRHCAAGDGADQAGHRPPRRRHRGGHG